VFSSDLYHHFISCLELPAQDGSRPYALRLLLFMLPPPHLILLEYLLTLFASIHENAITNQMNAYNLGLIFAPTLLRNKANKTPVEEYEKLARLLEYMILNLHQFIITHPLRDPENCLDLVVLPPLPYIYSATSGSAPLNLAKAALRSNSTKYLSTSPVLPEPYPLIFQTPGTEGNTKDNAIVDVVRRPKSAGSSPALNERSQ
jgi:hypothetical protein